MGLEPTNLLTASQALYQLSYAPVASATWVADVSSAFRCHDAMGAGATRSLALGCAEADTLLCSGATRNALPYLS